MNSIFSLASIKLAFIKYHKDKHGIEMHFIEDEWKRFKATLLEEAKPKDKK